MSAVRAKFVELFGEEQTAAIEKAGREHGVAHCRAPKGEGSDSFRWAIVIAIGYECMSRDSFRREHGITVPWDTLRAAIKDHAGLDQHDGDIDYLALMTGAYNEFMPDAPADAEVSP